MTGVKTNERPGTRAVLRFHRSSASKARQVLDLIRGQEVGRAADLLRTTPREAADVVGRVLASAVANAVHNDGQDADDLYVSACYADEGSTMKRWRPRARGRATRIRRRTCHITVVVSRLPDERLARRRSERDAAGARRARRVSASRRRADLSGRLSRRRQAQAEAARAAEEAKELEREAAATEPTNEGATEPTNEGATEAAAEEISGGDAVDPTTDEEGASGEDEDGADGEHPSDDETGKDE